MRIKAKETSKWKKALLPSLGIFLVYYLWLKFNVCHYSPMHILFMNISISLFLQSCSPHPLEVVPQFPPFPTHEEGEQIFHLLLITRYLSHKFLQLMYVTCGF